MTFTSTLSVVLTAVFSWSAIGWQLPPVPGQRLEAGTGWEYNTLYLDEAIAAALRSGSNIIAIARLGIGETSRDLNQRRLAGVAAYIEAHSSRVEIVLSEGAPLKAQGRVELNIDGKRFSLDPECAQKADSFLVAGRNMDLSLTDGP